MTVELSLRLSNPSIEMDFDVDGCIVDDDDERDEGTAETVSFDAALNAANREISLGGETPRMFHVSFERPLFDPGELPASKVKKMVPRLYCHQLSRGGTLHIYVPVSERIFNRLFAVSGEEAVTLNLTFPTMDGEFFEDGNFIVCGERLSLIHGMTSSLFIQVKPEPEDEEED